MKKFLLFLSMFCVAFSTENLNGFVVLESNVKPIYCAGGVIVSVATFFVAKSFIESSKECKN
jgi:hypothetical protein